MTAISEPEIHSIKCFLCNGIVSSEQTTRFEKNGVVVVFHNPCFQLFTDILHKALKPEDVSLPERPRTLSEFLHQKKPSTQPELLACAAYFLEQKRGGVVEFSTAEIREELVTTTVRIPDMGIALSNAVRRTPYLVRTGKRNRQYLYRLTEAGIALVQSLPIRH